VNDRQVFKAGQTLIQAASGYRACKGTARIHG
jgi:hypothetical protein